MMQQFTAEQLQLRGDGTPWPFVVINLQGEALAADSISELVDSMFPEHGQLNTDEQFVLRLRALAESAQSAQAIALVTHSIAGEMLPDEVLAVVTAPKDGPIVEVPSWPFEFPLYMLATQYAPFTSVPAPAGERVVLLDPSSERTFLEALAAAGELEFLINEQGLTTADPAAVTEASSSKKTSKI